MPLASCWNDISFHVWCRCSSGDSRREAQDLPLLLQSQLSDDMISLEFILLLNCVIHSLVMYLHTVVTIIVNIPVKVASYHADFEYSTIKNQTECEPVKISTMISRIVPYFPRPYFRRLH